MKEYYYLQRPLGGKNKKNRLMILKNIVGNGKVTIIVYLRRQDKYIESMCNQLIKMGIIHYKKTV